MTDAAYGQAWATGRARAVDERVETARASAAWAGYERIRDWYRALPDPDPDGVSAYWLEELETLEFMLDAGPLVIDRLRHHCYPVTGIRAYDYRTHQESGRKRLATKLAALVDLAGSDLLVPESPVLGGFGYQIDGGLYNIDTLKYLEVLIAMDRGGALGAIRSGGRRNVVWEIGAGWGGFAYQFKTLFPDTTYVMVDLPELFLYSATYLAAAFPDARITLWEGRPLSDDEWLASDFVLVPHTALQDVQPPWLDLALNMVSFQEMTHAQVTAYVEHAHALGAPFLASLNREHSRYNDEIESVSAILDERFYAREVPVLSVNYLKMLDRSEVEAAKSPLTAPARSSNDYRHIVGARRSLT